MLLVEIWIFDSQYFLNLYHLRTFDIYIYFFLLITHTTLLFLNSIYCFLFIALEIHSVLIHAVYLNEKTFWKKNYLDILTDLHVLRPTEYEKVVFGMPSVYLYISMYECEPRQLLNFWTNYISIRFIRMYSL
jgi:hypothetical protein